MPIIRNPFRKQDENIRPTTAASQLSDGAASKPVSIAEKEPVEYQLSEINDSGVYLSTSPPERKSFWPTSSSRSTTSSNHRSVFNENEQFNISRESFDSYRRSFDISARSPIIQPYEGRPRASLDSRTFERPAPRISLDVRGPPPPRTSSSIQRPSQVPAETREEVDAFEDVDIAEEPKPQPTKKRGLFARMVDGSVSNNPETAERPTSSEGGGKSWHHFGGRKRGQSGQGSELGAIKRENTFGGDMASQSKKETKVNGEKASSETPTQLAPQVDTREPTPDVPAPALEQLSLGASAQLAPTVTAKASNLPVATKAASTESEPAKESSTSETLKTDVQKAS
ncbi:Hypothetical protein R9X50_00238200 [Acrodontium crateriforme]|uniref:Uncharacterized protein n=1 Tax=Acrodontium crateriforme TaxID=150365 RepID=A0AAQ3R8I2_9PEZI|nr:Hypothetical protein R9X50_00238200 [Acrodontium crateriforme]